MSSDDRMLFVGLEIGGTNLKAGLLAGELGELVGNFKQEALATEPLAREPQAVVDQLVALGQSVLDEQGIAWADTLHVGVSCPGQIDREAGVVLAASNFPTWHNAPLAGLVQDKTGRPVTILNDASAAASAEFVGRDDHETIAVLTLGTGVGLGVVSAGRVVTGSRGLIEGGHMIVEPGPNARLCPCGQRGCLEAYASASSMVAIASERLSRCSPKASTQFQLFSVDAGDDEATEPSPVPSSRTSQAAMIFPRNRKGSVDTGLPSKVGERVRELERKRKASLEERGSVSPPLSKTSFFSSNGLGSEQQESGKDSPLAVAKAPSSSLGSLRRRGDRDGGAITAIDLFEMAKQGNQIAKGVVEEACAYLGLACVNICRMLDPDAILLTGGLSNAEGILDKVSKAFYSRGWDVLPHECEIGLASTCVPGSLGVFGAAGAAASEYARELRHSRSSRKQSSSLSSESRSHRHLSSSSIATPDATWDPMIEEVHANPDDKDKVKAGTESKSAVDVNSCSGDSADRDAGYSGKRALDCAAGRGEGVIGGSHRRESGVGWFLLGVGVGVAVASVAAVVVSNRSGVGGTKRYLADGRSAPL